MKTILSIVLFLFAPFVIFSQQIEGVVISGDDKATLPGVSVIEKGTSNGVITDVSGNFKITVTNAESVLVFSSVGMTPIEQVVGNSKKLFITLNPDVQVLNELVVIGYGTSLKKDLTGSISSVNMDNIINNNSGSVLNSLSGRIAGMDVTSSSGELGSDVNINIRGANSINAGTQPLYVIDGALIDVNTGEVATSAISGRTVYNPLASLNPADIESIQVLKDASATSIYGSAGANGVIVITTKQGQRNTTVVNFQAKVGISNPTKHIQMLQGQEFADYRFSRFPQSEEWGIDTDGDGMPDRVRFFPDEYDDDVSHDWQKELMRTAVFQNYNLSLSGSSSNNTLVYSGSLEYLNQEGIVKENNFKRYSTRYKLEYAPNKILKMGINGAIIRTDLLGAVTVGGGEAYNGWLESLLIYKPYNFKIDPGDPDNGGISNPELTLYNSYKKVPLNRIYANGFVELKPINGLTIRSSLNTGQTFSKSEEWYPSITSWGYVRNGLANILETSSDQWQSTTTATYAKSFKGGHHINAMLGFETSRYTWANLNVTAENFNVQVYNPVFDIGQAGVLRNKPASSKYTQTRMSEFGRIFYSLKDKYLVTATLRQDGSSKFGAGNRYALFPSVALAWKAHNEPFLKANGTFNELKFRASAGSSGNDRIPSYRSLSRLDLNYFMNVDGSAIMGLSPSELPNSKLKWETTDQYDLGIDVSLFKNRIGFVFDLYYKKTRDMLLHADVPGQSGSFKQWQNIGKIRNKGIEFTINTTNIKRSDFVWNTSFNISSNQNRILSLGNVNAIPISISDGVINEIARLKVGESIGSGWGYVFDGIYQTEDFDGNGNLKDGVTKIKGLTVNPGDMKFKDLDGDGEVDPVNDKKVISRSDPKFFGGIANDFQYKNFDLSFVMNFSYGNEVMNIGRWKYEGYSAYYNITEKYYTQRWTEENPTNKYPAIKGLGKNESSSYYVEDASFLRLQNVTLGYSMPLKYIKPIGLNGLRLSVSADNLFVLTKYSGFDPEVSYFNKLMTGLDNITYPRARSFSFNVNINL